MGQVRHDHVTTTAPHGHGRGGRSCTATTSTSSLSRFVFATAEYSSGDWESAPALPENLIDSVARYTSIDVAPSGVSVRLDSEELFDYPFVWLTATCPCALRRRSDAT